VGLRAGLHVLENRKISCPRPDSKPVPFHQQSSTSIDYAVPATKTKTNNVQIQLSDDDIRSYSWLKCWTLSIVPCIRNHSVSDDVRASVFKRKSERKKPRWWGRQKRQSRYWGNPDSETLWIFIVRWWTMSKISVTTMKGNHEA